MASGRMEFHSQTMMLHANFTFILPNDVAMVEVENRKHYERGPVNLILLHGLTGTDTDWLYGSMVQWMSKQYNLNVFMPTAGNTFYLNRGYRGANSMDFIAKELPGYIGKTFGIRMTKADTIIGGLSMGGYGALHTSLSYPEKYRACIALSSALITKDAAEGRTDGVLPEKMMRDNFGDPSKLADSDADPKYLYKKQKAAGKELPRIYIACGTEDRLLKANRDFRDMLYGESADLIYEEGPGKHNWVFWNEYLDRGLRAVLAD